MHQQNIFSEIPEPLPQEIFEEIVTTKTVRIERIVSKGHSSAKDFWYDQEQAEWVMLLKGRARLKFQGSGHIIEMGPGDYLDIPPHCRHRVEWTDPEEETIWLAVHYTL
jgi:cupin 2 domain-containing protein